MAFTERLAFLITAKGDDAISEFRKIGGAADSSLGKVDGKLAKLSGLAGNVSNTLSGPVVAGATAAAAAFTAFAASGVDKFMDLVEEVKEFQRVSGATSEDASRLIDAADFVGVSAEEAANGIFQLSQRLEKNKDALAAHGVSAQRSANGNVDLLATLLNVADVYDKTEDPVRRNQVVMDAFGRSGKALIPILAKGADELERMFAATSDDEIITPEEKKRAEEYREALNILDEAIGNLQLAIGEEAVPALADFANATAGAIEGARDAAEHVGGLGGVFKGVANALTGGAAGAVGQLAEWAGVTDDAGDAAKVAEPPIGEAGDAIEETGDKAKRAGVKIRSFTDDVDDAVSRAYDLGDAQRSVDEAFSALSEQATDRANARAGAEERVADAIEASERRIRDAKQGLADAEEDLQKIASGDRTSARRRVRDAAQEVADAEKDGAESVADARAELAETNSTLDDQADKVEDIGESVADVVKKMKEEGASALEVLTYIETQKSRLGEVGTQLGLNRDLVQQTLDLFTELAGLQKDVFARQFAPGSFGLGGDAQGSARTSNGGFGFASPGGVVIENLNVASSADTAQAIGDAIVRSLSVFGGRR